MKALSLLLLGSAAALVAAPVGAQTVAVVGGTLAIGDGSQPVANGTVVFRDGRIVAAGPNVAVPADATVIDAHGKWIAAGIVAGFSNLGLVDADGVEESNDERAGKSPFAAGIDIAPWINPQADAIGNERLGGITRAVVAPSAGGSIFAGEGAVIDLGVGSPPVTRPRAFEYVELGEGGGDVAGGSRPAAFAMFRDALAQAADYARDPRGFGGRERDSLLKRGDAEVLSAVIAGRLPLLVHVERASDILAVLALRDSYPRLKIVLLGAAEGWMVTQQIAAGHVPVIAEAITDLPAAFEKIAATESNVGRMTRADIPVAISTVGANTAPGEHVLSQYAGNLVGFGKLPGATGLDWGQAFATITSMPARAMGMDGEIGSLRPGRRADVVLWDGDPLELTSMPLAIWIDGRAQPMTSRQTELRDRYRVPGESALPKAYEH